MRTTRRNLWIFGLILAVVAASAGARAQSQAPYELLDRLMEAPPAPNPSLPQRRDVGDEPGAGIGFDPTTGEEALLPFSLAPRSREGQAIPGDPGRAAVELPETVDLIRRATVPTLPQPRTDTYGAPWRSHVKVLMTFTSNGRAYPFVCSGSMIGPFHVATAAHCIYNHDINGDGQLGDAGWATEVIVFPAQTDVVAPTRVPDHPLGMSRVTYMRTYNNWLNFGAFDWDIALLTLDRRIGDYAGWMGRETEVLTNSLNLNGYPAEVPFVPSGELRQYPSFDANNVVQYEENQIHTNAHTWGGHSGGPVWRHWNGADWLQGVNSRSDRAGNSDATRLTNEKFNDWETWMAEDRVTRVPASRPSLVEYVWPGSQKDLLTTQARPGENVIVLYNVMNAGFEPSLTVFVDIYLSTNTRIDPTDLRIGTVSFAGVDPYVGVNRTASVTLPSSVPPGTYFVGWRMSGARTEYETDDNAAVITARTLQVLPATTPPPTPPPTGCTLDFFEPDGDAAQARVVSPGFPQTRSLCPAGDHDWAIFAVAEDSEVVIETSGAPGSTGDTIVNLYDLSQAFLTTDDDGGADRFSRIVRSCGGNELAAGSYYVEVRHFGDNRSLDSYQLSVTATPCPPTPGPGPGPGPGPNPGAATGTPVSAQKLKLTDVGGSPERRKLKLTARDARIAPAMPAGPADPSVVGAMLRLENPVTGEAWDHALPASGWRRTARGYRFRGATCKVAFESGRMKTRCKGSGIGLSLDESSQGELFATFTPGAESVCMRFANTILADYGVGFGPRPAKGLFQVRDAPAPASCMTP